MASVDIANLQIRIADNSQKAADKILNLATALEELKNQKDGTGSALKVVAQDLATLKSADMGGLVRLRKQLASATEYANRLASAMDKVANLQPKLSKGATQTIAQSQKMSRPTTMGASPTAEVSDTVSNVVKNNGLAGTMEKVKSIAQKTGGVFKGIGKAGAEVFGNILPSGISNTISQLSRLMKMRILRTIVKSILSGMTEGLQNCYYWAKAVGDGFANSMDMIQTSMNYVKNSIGAAFASILNIVAPTIDSLVEALVTGINYINMFFATLSGASTYTRAKKVAVEYGKATSGALGGASAAAKDLKAQLSVLDFDELHQLQEQATPSGGGGGGGGGGGSATNYNDMFEKAAIEDNWLTRIAGWLRDNFQEVLEIVEAIGIGILAWKLADAFSDNIKKLSGIQKLGFALTITGIAVEYQGSYGLGHDGYNTEDLVKTLIGSALQIGGITMMTGSLAAGFMIGIPLALVVSVVGYVNGVKARFKEDLENNAEYQRALAELDKATEKHKVYQDILVEVRKIEFNYRDSMSKADRAQSIIDELFGLEGMDATPEIQRKVQGLVDQFNSLGFEDIYAKWDVVNGKIETNVEDLQKAIDKFKEYARTTALEDLYVQLDIATAEQNVAQSDKDYYQWEYEQALGRVRELAPELLYNMDDHLGNGAGWQPGEDPYDAIANKEHLKEVLEELATAEKWYESILEADAIIADKDGVVSHIQALIDELLNLSAAADGVSFNKYDLSNPTNNPFQSQSRIGNIFQSAQQNMPSLSSGGLNIFADPSLNAGFDNYKNNLTEVINLTGEVPNEVGTTVVVNGVPTYVTDTNKTVTATEKVPKEMSTGVKLIGLASYIASSITAYSSVKNLDQINGQLTDTFKKQGAETKKTTTETNNFWSATNNVRGIGGQAAKTQELLALQIKGVGTQSKTASGHVGLINTALGNVGKGVNYTSITTGIKNSLNSKTLTEAGTNMKNKIETELKKLGGGLNYGSILTGMNTGFTNAKKTVQFTNTGKSIAVDIQNGTINSYNAPDTIKRLRTNTTNAKSGLPFNTIGNTIGKDIQNGSAAGYDGLVPVKKYLSAISTARGKTDFYGQGSGIRASIQQGAAAGFDGLGLLTGYKNGMNNNQPRVGFGGIGTLIANSVYKGSYDGFSSYQLVSAYQSGMSQNAGKVGFGGVGGNVASYVYSGAYNGFSTWGLIRDYWYGMDYATANMGFGTIGGYIASYIKSGIKSTLSGSTMSISVGIGSAVKWMEANINAYATGGFPTPGELFLANEAGAEMVGTVGGRTAVANNEQIASAIARALKPMLSGGGRNETTQMNLYLDSQIVAKAAAKGQSAMNKQYNLTAKA